MSGDAAGQCGAELDEPAVGRRGEPDLLGGNGPAEMEALSGVESKSGEYLEGVRLLQALGDDGQTQR
jgi:hypothetical protein